MNKLFMVLWEVKFFNGKTYRLLIPRSMDPVEWYRERPDRVSEITRIRDIEVLYSSSAPTFDIEHLGHVEYEIGGLYTLVLDMVDLNLWFGNNFPNVSKYAKMEVDYDTIVYGIDDAIEGIDY